MAIKYLLPAALAVAVLTVPTAAYAAPSPDVPHPAPSSSTAQDRNSATVAPEPTASDKRRPSAGPTVPQSRQSENARQAPVTQAEAKRLEDFWTPDRMDQAKPVAEQAEREAKLPPEAREPRRQSMSPSHPFKGIKQVGTFFYQEDDQYRFCAGTVVPSPGKNIVATAAHCFDSSDRVTKLVFVPQHHEAEPRPHGVFPISVGKIYMDPAYITPGGDKAYTDLDFAFLQTSPRSDGKKVEEVVGAIPLALNAGFDHPDTQVIGYPYLPGMDGYKPKQNPLTCTTPLKKFTTASADGWKGGTFAEVNCDGYVSGTSGGPFLIKKDGGLALAGVTGGWKTGGHSPDTSYSSYFDNDVKRVFDAAVAGKQPPTRSVLPGAETWKHAEEIASGYFALDGEDVPNDRMDMFVLWSDGELTVYRGASADRGHFDKEYKIKAPSAQWGDHAVEVTAGDFTGDNGSDLIVRWSDGELTLYPSVDEKGFHGEKQLQPPNATWKHAEAITAGRFSANKWQDDLVVRWSDGELSLYTDVSDKGLGKETKVVAPNKLWTHATEIGSGDYTGNDNWDLIVRWSDGELTNYQDFTGGAPWGENKLHGPDSTWTHALIVSGGDYSDNPHPDDTIVRWSDGELTLYTDGNAQSIGRENQLVSP
ncbi:trypsin-like serine peptidase [Streptomyces platensis]|uniref:trypsin-like serine peptidase n=1 Tax=Streptomyces platensis TaxID=58346 RepID=UPI00332D41E6